MSIIVTILFVVMALIVGVCVTAAMFCMRERNSARSEYNELHEKWEGDNEYIMELERDNAQSRSDARYWEEKYKDVAGITDPVAVIETPTPVM